MKQNLTRKKAVFFSFFFFFFFFFLPAYWALGKTGITGLFFCKGMFFNSWVDNLMVFKKSDLGLEKIDGLGLATSLIRYFNYCFNKQLCKK